LKEILRGGKPVEQCNFAGYNKKNGKIDIALHLIKLLKKTKKKSSKVRSLCKPVSSISHGKMEYPHSKKKTKEITRKKK